MKNILIGFVAASALLLSAHAFAATIEVHGIQFVEILRPQAMWGVNGALRKFYDYDNGVVCYSYSGGGISCLHN